VLSLGVWLEVWCRFLHRCYLMLLGWGGA
jgi:hypothetical protein